MIPKIIHYCWLGNGKKSPLIKFCINSWMKYMPDWEFIEWNETNFDINSSEYVKDAIKERKYAFASDYIRLYALYHYGGIYLDTDLQVFCSLESFRTNKMFTAHECFDDTFIKYKDSIDHEGVHKPSTPIGGFGIMSAIIGAEKNHWFIKECLDFYQTIKFSKDNLIIIDGLMATLLEKYGYRYKDEFQTLKDINIFTSDDFLTNKNKYTHNVVAIHWCTGSWGNLNLKRKIIFSIPIIALKYFRIKSFFKNICK